MIKSRGLLFTHQLLKDRLSEKYRKKGADLFENPFFRLHYMGQHITFYFLRDLESLFS